MTAASLRKTVFFGVVLTAIYTFLISGADAITKQFAASYAAPQLFALSGLLVAGFCLLIQPVHSHQLLNVKTKCPRAMAVRTVATVAGTFAFYYAFRLLPFADVFIFIALIPMMAAFLSAVFLNERVGIQSCSALALGLIGLTCLFPSGTQSMSWGHLIAFAAAALGTISVVSSRYIGQRDRNLLMQVFYPYLALGMVALIALPFVYQAMPITDVLLAVCYALLLFVARWVLAGALRLLPAYVVTPLMNLQFLWMVGIGVLVFGERPGPEVYAGAFLVILAGAWLVWDQTQPRRLQRAVPAE